MATALPTTPAPRDIVVRWRSNALRYVSPLSGATQTSARLGGVWVLRIELPAMSRYDASQWVGAIFGADGYATALEAGPFQPYPADHYNASAPFTAEEDATVRLDFVESDYRVRYITAPTVLANGAASAAATSLPVDGLDGIGLNAGTFLAVDNGTYKELHVITVDAFPNASGEATLTIHPGLRRAVANNATVDLVNPRGEFHFTNEDGASVQIDTRQVVAGLTLELEEFVR